MTKNADMPAMPTQYMDNTQGNGELYCDQAGLTKREHFAVMAMQGILANSHWAERGDHLTSVAAKAAIEYADGLLAELEK